MKKKLYFAKPLSHESMSTVISTPDRSPLPDAALPLSTSHSLLQEKPFYFFLVLDIFISFFIYILKKNEIGFKEKDETDDIIYVRIASGKKSIPG